MEKNIAKPFVKWAGGKSRILNFLTDHLPGELKNGNMINYVEPFVGGGSLFFHVMNNYQIEKAIINDSNFSLIACYLTVQKDVDKLIEKLRDISDEYYSITLEDCKKQFYYHVRSEFNILKKRLEKNNKSNGKIEYSKNFVEFAKFFIFLNKFCFNGLFRLNSKGEFNVPMGNYNNPDIISEKNLKNINKILRKTRIYNYDFEKIERQISDFSFVYIDPPYRVQKNNGFLEYNEKIFSWDDQIRLSKMIYRLSQNKVDMMISNANNPNIIDMYEDFYISTTHRNCVIGGGNSYRKKVKEIILTNYDTTKLKKLII